LNTFLSESPTDDEISKIIHLAIRNKKIHSQLVDDFKKTDPRVRKKLAEDLAQGEFLDEFTIFKNLTIPKLIIAGDSDPSVNRAYLSEVKNACNGTCDIYDFKNCGHYPSIENPIKFIEIIHSFSSSIFKS
jgi:pimeloyl-ACP methyl ester carboxylesterase